MNETLNDLKNFYHKVNTIEGLLNVFINIFGSDELKEKADYVAAANVDDGIYKACGENGWFEHI